MCPKSVKLVAAETIYMNDAAEELKNGENVDNIVDVGVSCDDSWSGEVFVNSIMTAISI